MRHVVWSLVLCLVWTMIVAAQSTLARRAGGTCPAQRVERSVTSGGVRLAAHGSSEMPVWGPTFLALEPSDTLVKTRIANVVRYIESIQTR